MSRSTYQPTREGLFEPPLSAEIVNIQRHEPRSRGVPEIRIVRKTDIEGIKSPLVDQWNDYLNKFGEENYGLGMVKTLGSIALVYVNAQECARMFSKKYPKIF